MAALALAFVIVAIITLVLGKVIDTDTISIIGVGITILSLAVALLIFLWTLEDNARLDARLGAAHAALRALGSDVPPDDVVAGVESHVGHSIDFDSPSTSVYQEPGQGPRPWIIILEGGNEIYRGTKGGRGKTEPTIAKIYPAQ